MGREIRYVVLDGSLKLLENATFLGVSE